MSSLLRRMQRKLLRSSASYVAPAGQVRVHADGSYDALHPTRGWKHISAKRAALYV